MIDMLLASGGNITNLLTFALVIFAWRGGAGPERATISILFAMVVIDRSYHLIASGGATITTQSNYMQADTAHFLIDGLATVALMAIALKANRMYPLWIAGIQILALLTHIGREVSPFVMPTAYATFNRAPFYLQLALSCAGLVAYRRRLIVYGLHRSWRRTSADRVTLRTD